MYPVSEPTVDFPETTADQWEDRNRDVARNRCGDRDRDTEDRNGDKGEDWKIKNRGNREPGVTNGVTELPVCMGL